jgi:preprotein translocase subunit YajC
MTLLELLPFAAVLLAGWLLLIRPARNRRDAHDRLVASLAPGARIMTTAGVFGTVRTVDAERMTLEVAPGVVIEMVPQAVGRIVAEADAPTVEPTFPAAPAEPDHPVAPVESEDRKEGDRG